MCELAHLTLHRAGGQHRYAARQEALTAICQKNLIRVTANVKSVLSLGVSIILYLIVDCFHGITQSNAYLWRT